MSTPADTQPTPEAQGTAIPRSRPVEVALLGALSTIFLASLAVTMVVT